MADESGTSADPDLELVNALSGGDESALDKLMARYAEPIFRFIYRNISNEADARELVQEVFVRLYFNIKKFKPDAKFSTWLYQIALNLCRDRAKSRSARQAAITESLSAHENADDQLIRESAIEKRTPYNEAITREKMSALEDGMGTLPSDLREALVLTVLEQRSHRECAEILKTTPKAIETRVYRARKHLHEWLAKAGFIFLVVNFF